MTNTDAKNEKKLKRAARREERRNKHFRWGIKRQIAYPALFILFFFTVIILSIVAIQNMMMHINEKIEDAVSVSQNAKGEVESYDSLTFLIDYWLNHSSEMELLYDHGKILEKERELRSLWKDMPDIKTVTEEDLASQSDEVKRIFAEIAYGNMTEDLNRIKHSFNILYVSVFVVKGDKRYFMVTGADNSSRESQGGDVYELGKVIDYKPGTYVALDNIVINHTTEPSTSFGTSQSHPLLFHSFLPIFSDGNYVAIVSTTVNAATLVRQGFYSSSFEAVAMTLLFLFVALWFSYILRVKVLDPLKKEEKAMRIYRSDKQSGAVIEKMDTIRSRNEIQLLSAEFKSLVSDLDQYMAEIESSAAERERISAELDVATGIQSGMLPDTFPDNPAFDLQASMAPAKEVGGDFFDYFMIDDTHIGLVIADVSGKGIPAALFMAISMVTIKNRTMVGGTLEDIISDVNNTLCERNPKEFFVTVWIAIVDLKTGDADIVNAGHEHPTICKAGGQFEYSVYRHSSPLGIMPDMRFRQHSVHLDPGDRIFVYTDGAPEATNAENELFGEERLLGALNASVNSSSEELLKNVRASIDAFVKDAPQFDDLTMLTFLYKGFSEN